MFLFQFRTQLEEKRQKRKSITQTPKSNTPMQSTPCQV